MRLSMIIVSFLLLMFSTQAYAESSAGGNDTAAVSDSSSDTSMNAKPKVKYVSGFSNPSSNATQTNTTVQTENTSKAMTPEEIDKEFKEKYKPLVSK